MKKPAEDAIRVIRKDGRKLNLKLVVICDNARMSEMEYSAGKFSIGESKEAILPKIDGKTFAGVPMVDILDRRFPELGLKKSESAPKKVTEKPKAKRGRKKKVVND